MSLCKKNILFIVIFTLCAFVSAPALVWIVDPFHIYHRDTWLNKGKIVGGGIDSLKNGGLLECACLNGGIDGVICGGCVSNGVNTSDFKRSVQGEKRFIHFYTTGIYVKFIHLEMLQETFRRQDVKHVVLLNPPIVFSKVPFKRADLFYSPKRILFEATGFFSAMAVVLSHFRLRALRTPEMAHLWQPEDPKEFFKHAMKSQNKGAISSVIIDDKFQNTTDNPLLQLITEHPEVTFYLLFFPQWSLNDKNAVGINLKDTSFYIENTKTFQNVKIHSFHDVPHTVIATNWEESVHFFHFFSPVFCKFMAYCIEHNLHRVTAENYETYKQHILDVLKSFNPSDYPDRPTTFEELVAYEESLHPELKKEKMSVEEP